MKKCIAALLAVLLMLGIGLLPATVAEEADDYGVTRAKYGDVTLDQTINATDALAILQSAVAKRQLNELQAIVANVNTDNDINAVDALMVLQFAVGKLAAFPAGEEYSAKPPVPSDPILAFDKTNSVNGAYEADETADTGFSVDISSLQDHTIYRLSPAVLNSNYDAARLVYSLQGLINRDFGMDENHTSLVYIVSEASDTAWLTQITGESDIMHGLANATVKTFDDFLEQFGEVIKSCGLVLWDGNVPATANVAATICGLDGYLPVLAESPLHTQLVAAGVPVKQSLVGMFENGKKGHKIYGTNLTSTGSAKNDAYLWALEKYFARCSSTYLAYTLDGAVCLKGYTAYPNHPNALLDTSSINCLSNHDYLIARRCFFFDLAVYKGEAACDDPAQKEGLASAGEDHNTMVKIFNARYQRAGGAIGQLMGFPPWWVKYTNHHNQGGKVGTWIEWLFSEYITCYNLAKEADAQAPAAMTNGSAYYKYVPHKARYEANHSRQNLTFDASKVYYTIYVGDYDSSAWMKMHVHAMWVNRGGDKNRGKLPLMWAYNPNLSYRVPMIFDYIYENQTGNDFFVAGDSGAGYVIPAGLFGGTNLKYMGEARPAAYPDAGQLWADYCKAFYKRFDIDITGFIINGENPLTTKIAACYNQFSTAGSFHNMPAYRLGLYNSVPYVYCDNGWGNETSHTDAAAAMYTRAKSTLGVYKLNFMASRTICWTPTKIKNLVSAFESYAAERDLTVEYVDPYTMFDLIKQ